MKPEDVRKYIEDTPDAGGAAAGTVPAQPQAAAAPANVTQTQRHELLYKSISASYHRLRRGLAIVALAFPVLLLLGVGLDQVQTSISAYYHYNEDAASTYGAGSMRNLFFGVLWAIGTFLYFYKGYSRREDLALDVAGLAAIGVALFPMDWPRDADVVRTWSATVHYGCAVTFFVAIAYVCLFRSGDTLKELKDAAKQRGFKLWYTILAALMVGAPLTVLLIHWLSRRPQDSLAVLLIEIAGVWVFSIFWLLKSHEISLIERQKNLRP